MGARYTVAQHAALSRLAATLGHLVTGPYIDEECRRERLPSEGSSKKKRISCMLEAIWERIPRRTWTKRRLENLLVVWTMEGYRRFAAGQVEMTHAQVDGIVGDMKALGLDASALADKKWRKNLPGAEEKEQRTRRGRSSSLDTQTVAKGVAAYPEVAEEIKAYLSPTNSVSPQARGVRLEVLVERILDAEGLSPRGPLRNAGEEIDRTFALQHMSYLLECKWEQAPVGFPEVRDFIGKVGRKAEGTFGVFLSMSGFVSDINHSAARGQRLNCVGLTGQQFMNVVDGRCTWASLVLAARRAASDRSVFLATAD